MDRFICGHKLSDWIFLAMILVFGAVMFFGCNESTDPDSGDYANAPFAVWLDNTTINAIDVGGDGFIYATGTTNNPGLGGGDGGVWGADFTGNGSTFILKYAPDGQRLRGTYLATGKGEGITIDASGNVIVGGSTNDPNWPTKNAFQDTYHPGSAGNCFVTKLGPGLKDMTYSTYIGGGSNHAGDSNDGSSVKTMVAMDGTAYFIISSQDNDFPLGKNGLSIMGQPNDPGYSIWPMECAYGCNMSPPVWSRVIVGRMSPDGDYTGICLGGYEPDTTSGALAVDANGIYTGCRFKWGGQLRFATSTGAYRTEAYQSGQSYFDCAASKISRDFDNLIYSTYIGGRNQNDLMSSVVKDGCLILLGKTRSTDYPTVNPIQGHNSGDYDWTITKLAGDGRSLIASTYYGTGGDDNPREICIDESGRLWIVGQLNGHPHLVRISADLQRVEEDRQLGNGTVTGLALGDGCVVYCINEGNVARIVKEMR